MSKKKTAKKTVRRKRRSLDESVGDIYGFRQKPVETFSTGCTILDCVQGGGWARRRMGNIIGDRSTGKTLLAEEACANFLLKYPTGIADYYEFEAAFDMSYAEALGLPMDRINFPNDPETCAREGRNHIAYVEEWCEVITKLTKANDRPRLIICDSVDAMGSLEDEEGISKSADGKGGWQLGKQKALSRLFRNLVMPMQEKDVTLLMISQVRDNIGVTFGSKLRRSGGRALDFYATHALWLANMGQIKITRKKVSRTIGVHVRAQCKKNKIGAPFREAEIPLLFSYGIDDVDASLNWLIQMKRTASIGLSEDNAKKLRARLHRLTADEYEEERLNTSEAVLEVWADIESDFKPTRKKYGTQS